MSNKDYSKILSGQVGENLIVSELGRRGIVATTFAGNVPDIDILAYKNNKSIPLQIKSLASGSLRTNAKKYLNIELKGKKQIIKSLNDNVDRNLIFIIILIGKKLGEDKFYIVKQGIIQDLVYNEHNNFLKKHNGVRPRRFDSFDCSVHLKDLESYENNWSLIENKF